MLNTAIDPQDFQRQKTFLKLAAAKFNLSADGNRLSVSVYTDTLDHQISLAANYDNKRFASKVDNLRPRTGAYRLDLAIQGVLNTYFLIGRPSPSAKVIVLVVSHNFHRSSNFCPSYVQPFELARQLKEAGVRVITAVVSVNISEDFKELFESDDEIWHFQDYEELVSLAANFSTAVCRTAGNN